MGQALEIFVHFVTSSVKQQLIYSYIFLQFIPSSTHLNIDEQLGLNILKQLKRSLAEKCTLK